VTFHLVDLPGYGFTRRSKAEQRAWASLIEGYLATRPTLAAVVVIVDARRGLEEDDRALCDLIAAAAPPSRRPVEVLLVATKIDTRRRSERKVVRRGRQGAVGRKIYGLSSLTGEGREDLWRALRRAALGEIEPSRPGPSIGDQNG